MANDSDQGLSTGSSARGGEFLHRSVADALRRQLAEGSLADGSKLPPLREIADEFEVSTMTVRQALRTLEREGHVYRIPGVGAFVRPTPPGKPTARKMLAFAATDLTSAFEMGIARGIERTCQKRGWATQILDAQHRPELEARNILRLPDCGAQAAIILPTCGDPRTVQRLFEVESGGFPVVVVDRTPPGLATDFVESNHEQGAYQATRHLLDHGHSHVFLVTPPPKVSSIAARIHGYERALWDAGREPLPEWKVWLDLEVQAAAFREGRKWRGGYSAIMPVLRERKPPLAIFAVDPYTAWGVYEACRELGLRIPGDVSIVGFDDSEIALAMRPPITIVSQRTHEIGRAAVELLARRIETGRTESGSRKTFMHAMIETDLIPRESVASVGGG